MTEIVDSYQRVEVLKEQGEVNLYSTCVGTFTDHPRKKIGEYASFESAEKSRLRRARLMSASELGFKATGLAAILSGSIFTINAMLNEFQNNHQPLDGDIIRTSAAVVVAITSMAGGILSKEQKMKVDQQLDAIPKAAALNTSYSHTYSMDPK